MLVTLRNNWFDPTGTYRKASKSPHIFPDSWEELLPKSAEVIEEKKAAPVKVEPKK